MIVPGNSALVLDIIFRQNIFLLCSSTFKIFTGEGIFFYAKSWLELLINLGKEITFLTDVDNLVLEI